MESFDPISEAKKACLSATLCNQLQWSFNDTGNEGKDSLVIIISSSRLKSPPYQRWVASPGYHAARSQETNHSRIPQLSSLQSPIN
jgi:hypothetical protein